MILVVKKSKKIVPFNREKIHTSIKNTALDLSYKFSKKEIELLVKTIEEKIKRIKHIENQEKTSHYEIRSIIYETLIENGYTKIANKYITDLF